MAYRQHRNLLAGDTVFCFFFYQFVSADAMPPLSPLGEIKHKGEICVNYRFMFHGQMSVLLKY